MMDTHCHVDLYPDPHLIVEACEAAKIYTIAVTNAPSVFQATEALSAGRRYVRPAVGIHPELAVQRRGELTLLREALERTRYVGEVGLDYTVPESDRRLQQWVFEQVLEACDALGGKILTVHSRRAADDVIRAIGQGFNGTAILHWYSGGVRALRTAVENGLYFSINPAMVRGRRFAKLLSEIPRERVLLESDGPFVSVEGRPATPRDTAAVVGKLAAEWCLPRPDVGEILRANFARVLGTG